MKTIKINLTKALFLITMMGSVLISCGQAEKSKEVKNASVSPEMNIHSAIISGNIEVVKQHIEAGTNLNEKEPMSGATPLITAITFDKREIAKVLIDADSDLSIKNNDGSTALHVAAFFCRVEIVQMLIDANADKTAKNNYGATPLETVSGDFKDIKPIYQMLKEQLSPLGLKLDMDELEKTRPVIAMMLQ
ncbi:ankyrin repeat domain-containing protein [Marinigracilibium pacificum]|uniref:Ankyrin repeat domain-containing protein n=1 Tax=Marinigracilibium pacificum TaxID=2729599 RepID=A0A848J512_9BACT|nr:ankyrin repeat domain-containing protein [Marinigracilibium pacificum]NMM50806.1 ankyrin repeat domain-containing protein [Marinigracilibium pacificum]